MSHAEFRHPIDALVEQVSAALLDAEPTLISYVDTVDLARNQLPETFGGRRLNLYAIWTREPGAETWCVRYIGERSTAKLKGEGCTRLGEHLFKKRHEKTGSQLERVREAVARGASIGVTTAYVAPESMRLAVEEELIAIGFSRGHDLWNRHGRPKKVAAPRVRRSAPRARAAAVRPRH